ncbi:AEC family transporter [Marispirochaeta aestuarii]|nr:AEC family transporter [Marispirochaeta aestuarii]
MILIVNTVIPIFFIAAIGWVFGKRIDFSLEMPARMTLYVFTPCLFFSSILNAELQISDFGPIFLFSILLFLISTALAYLVSKVLRFTRQKRNALFLSSCFPNSGNYGLPMVLFAFEQAGFERAIVFAMFQVLLINSAGVYFASHNSRSVIKSIKTILSFPGFIAVLLAVFIKWTAITIPVPILRPIHLLGQASVPTLLIILGIQLARIKIVSDYRFLITASALRLLSYPVVGLVLAISIFGAESLSTQVLFLISASPTGITPALLAERYGTEPGLVSAATFVTTALSIITVPVVLVLIS